MDDQARRSPEGDAPRRSRRRRSRSKSRPRRPSEDEGPPPVRTIRPNRTGGRGGEGRASRGTERQDRDSARRTEESRGRGHVRKTLRKSELSPTALDRDARRVVSRLQQAGHEAYLVGGCVRDLLIGRRPKDFDVATSATPGEIRRLFRNGRIIGRRFKLVHIHYGQHIIETSTFRREPDESDEEDLLIREDNEFGTAEEDARRRDFTVNALFLDPSEPCIHDWCRGLEDLEARLLRTIGVPQVRFAEDPVRIMRAVKFATRLDFEIEDNTWEAMVETSEQLTRSAPPRLLEELYRLLRSGSALGAIKMLRACGALRALLPQLEEALGPRDADDHDVQQDLGLYLRQLEALDQEVHAGEEPSNAICLAVLLSPLVETQLQSEEDPRRARELVEEAFEPIAHELKIARRDWLTAARLLGDQCLLLTPQREKFSPLLHCLDRNFEESMRLFGIRIHSRGKGWDLHEAWEDRLEEALGASKEDIEAERKRLRGRKKRRRRTRKKGPGGSSRGKSGNS